MRQQREFKKFKKYFCYWKDRLGLKGWRILYFKMMPIDENGCPYARVNYINEQREAWVYFWGSGEGRRKDWAKEKALHEVLHLLFAHLNLKEEEEHSLINTIINTFYDGGYNGDNRSGLAN